MPSIEYVRAIGGGGIMVMMLMQSVFGAALASPADRTVCNRCRCAIAKPLWCARCHTVVYCSEACQRAAWTATTASSPHRTDCAVIVQLQLQLIRSIVHAVTPALLRAHRLYDGKNNDMASLLPLKLVIMRDEARDDVVTLELCEWEDDDTDRIKAQIDTNCRFLERMCANVRSQIDRHVEQLVALANDDDMPVVAQDAAVTLAADITSSSAVPPPIGNNSANNITVAALLMRPRHASPCIVRAVATYVDVRPAYTNAEHQRWWKRYHARRRRLGGAVSGFDAARRAFLETVEKVKRQQQQQ